MINILFVISSYFPSKLMGGVGTVAKDIFDKFNSDKKYNVKMLTSNLINVNNGKMNKISNNIENIIMINVYGFIFNFIIFFNIFLIGKSIKKSDIIYLHDARGLLHIVVTFYVYIYDKKIIYQPHGALLRSDSEKELLYYFLISFYDIIFLKLLKIQINKNGVILVLTELEKNDAKKLNFTNIHVVRNGKRTLLNFNREKIIYKKLNKKEITITYFGRIASRKRIDRIINFFSLINIINKNRKLINFNIVGKIEDYTIDDLENKIREYGNGKCSINGWISENKKIELFMDTDYIVLLSDRETFPMVLLEALYYGCIPIFRSDLGIFKLLNEKKIGYVLDNISKHNVEKIYHKMISTKENDFLVKNKVNQSIDLIECELSFKNTIKDIVIIIDNLHKNS